MTTIAADGWHLCQILRPLIKHEAIVAFGQEHGRLLLNDRYVVCTTIHLFLESNRSLDYICEMNPELYNRLTDRTADFCCAGNSLASIIHHLFSVHLEKGFQVANRDAIDLQAQAEREAYRHLDDNLAAFIVCYMPPYYTEMMPTAKEFAEHRSVHLRSQLGHDPRLLPNRLMP
uniref:Uncharacterized protein n=1 Tax=Romanomermis culicivorax TaxID=13658 RepID=A0A915JX24_ROMCU